MPLQSFVDGGLPTIKADWLNAVDAFYFTLFNSATTAAAARTALSVLSLAGGTMTGPLVMSGAALENIKTTAIGDATATPIWTGGGVINLTGTPTITAFPNAPYSGTSRRLICASACAITTGAKLIIPGVTSGKTITMNTGAIIDILCISGVDTFQLDYQLYGTFNTVSTGFTNDAATVQTWVYSVRNGDVHVSTLGATGLGTGTTSSQTYFTISGFPACIIPSTNRFLSPLVATDNGVILYTATGVLANTGIMSLYPTFAGGDWTAAASAKLFQSGDLMYQL